MDENKIIVVKYGSSSVSNGSGMDREKLKKYAADLAKANKKYQIVIVSSGSVAVGKSIWQKPAPGETADGRTLAMIGSAKSFVAWQEELGEHGLIAGQLLVTHREVDDPSEGPSLHQALATNLQHGIVTVANENDALSTTELAKLSYGGDNDGLAAHIAKRVRASALCLMTGTDGLLSKGKPVRLVKANARSWAAAQGYVEEEFSPAGRGGMLSKVEAATVAAESGINAYIASADTDIEEVLAGKSGTHFEAIQ